MHVVEEKMTSIKTTIEAMQYRGINSSIIIRAGKTAGEAVLTKIHIPDADVPDALLTLDVPCIREP